MRATITRYVAWDLLRVFSQSLAMLTITLSGSHSVAAECVDASLDALRRAVPAAAALPLLVALARGEPAQSLAIEYLPTMGLQLRLVPVPQAAMLEAP